MSINTWTYYANSNVLSSPIHARSTEAEVTSAQQTVPVAATATDSNDETSEEPAATDDIDENDCKSLRSILNDGHYDISEENHTALKSVVATVHSVKYLYISSTDDEEDDEEIMSITDSDISSESLTTVSSISLLQW